MTPRADLPPLHEGQAVDGLHLTVAQAAALNASALVTVAPTADGWRLTAAHAVGALQVGDVLVRVHPKVGVVQALRLLARARGLRRLFLDEQNVPLAQSDELTAVLAVMFVREARGALRAGPIRGYRTEDQSLPVLRGRVRMMDQHLRRYGAAVPVEVTVDEWTADTDENRLIRAATRRLLLPPGVPSDVRALLSHIDRQLGDVSHLVPGQPPPRWAATRLNTPLHNLLPLAELILHLQGVEHSDGDLPVRGFVISMAQLFEDLVGQLMVELDDDVRVVRQRTTRLDTLGRLTIRPDLVFLRHGTPVAVADTKYKILGDDGRLRNEDAYQLITYCQRLGLREGHLIYAAGTVRDGPFEVHGTGVTLHVHKVDLTCPTSNVEDQVATVRARAITP